MLTPELMKTLIAGVSNGLGIQRAVTLDITNGTGGAADTSVQLKPQTNAGVPLPDTIWIVQHCMVFHDDASNRNIIYFFTDATTPVPMQQSGSIAANTYSSLYNICVTRLPFIVDLTNFVYATCYSLANTKKVKLRAVVWEISPFSQYLSKIGQV